MLGAYQRLHELGIAHSVEAWSGDLLVGGIYGVWIRGVFSAESMFFRQSGASRAALLHLVAHLQSQGLGWLDIQVLTPHLEKLGAREIPRDDFLKLLARAQTV
jgi:leucyl/phenylalanyl-tRNA--protein transferase